MSFVSSSFNSTPSFRKGQRSFIGSENNSVVDTSNDPNELEIEQSSDESVGDPKGDEEFFMESFSKSSIIPQADESQILQSLNSTLEQSRSDPSAIDLSAITEEPKEKVAKGDVSATCESEITMHSTPLAVKTFKRRNTLPRS